MKKFFFIILIFSFIRCSTSKSGLRLKKTTSTSSYYRVISIVQGDIMCYIKLIDDKNRELYMDADFSICEKKLKFINKKVTIKKTKMVNVMDCQSIEPCGKSKRVRLVTELELY